jgi:antitoxin component of MazEF toxin-antitoxin module
MIKKKITQIGTSWGVIIPKAIIEGLGINPVLDTVEIYIENNEIRIRKIQK